MVNDEDIITEHLGTDIGRVEPGPAPVDAVIGQGKAIKARRRAMAGSGLAVAAVLGVGLPLALSGHQAGVPSAGTGHRVTVDAPHKDAKGTTVFSGSIDGHAWNAPVEVLHRGGGAACIMSFGNCASGFPVTTDPAALSASSGTGQPDQYTVDFRADVKRVEIALQNGQTLPLDPMPVSDHRLALFELPSGLRISRVTAYGADGNGVGFAIPFQQPGGASTTVTWNAPDATPDLSEASARIASGVTPGMTGEEKWSVTAYVGPYGQCVVQSASRSGTVSRCVNRDTKPPTSLAFTRVKANGMPYWLQSEIDTSVDHLDVAYSDGSTKRLTPTRLAGHAFVGLVVPVGLEVESVTTFDSAGRQLGLDTGDAAPTK
ncbi:hypothetical protein [Streptomyces sp. NRRL F-5123]|uniref:hypothetical protein n=1 Tax=Streptomyces sp. NRRL F-5123 TaxID=1463856 RepID=UPI0004E0D803|nr:hypothetical protein [Streptomyces sp. NRRL F-5123]